MGTDTQFSDQNLALVPPKRGTSPKFMRAGAFLCAAFAQYPLGDATPRINPNPQLIVKVITKKVAT